MTTFALFDRTPILNRRSVWGPVLEMVGGAVLAVLAGAPIRVIALMTHYNKESPKKLVGLFLELGALGIFAQAMRVMDLLLQVAGVTLLSGVMGTISAQRAAGQSSAGWAGQEEWVRAVHCRRESAPARPLLRQRRLSSLGSVLTNNGAIHAVIE